MNDLIAQARERCNNTSAWPWHSDQCLIWKLADALEKAEADNEKLAVHGGKYMEIAQKRYEMFEAATARAEKAEAELAAYKEANPPRVHGEWVYDHWCEFKCSCCGNMSTSSPRGRESFCPACGADMRKEPT